ncbi:MAG TPA: DEAD/DEAH box helicase [Polyangiaceae bacterium]|nr:DEAD/DEAH box helicase [Polyangiaceae bacterium]
MTIDSSFDRVPPPLRDAMLERGFSSLTPVQSAVVEPGLEGRDLRISSQTGSGKTVAIGLVLAAWLAPEPGGAEGRGAPRDRACRPRAIVVAPTRELAAQVSNELAWLLAPVGGRTVTVTGGTNVGVELRALARGAEVVVGTPGRLLDHLSRGAIDAGDVRAVVLDEADQLLDLGFRDELEAIVEGLPEERQTLLVSATFPRDVLALADRYQRDPVAVAGTPPGDANADIAHVAHLVRADERFDALVNLLLVAPPDERTLVFARTRAGAAELADLLAHERFAAAGLTGEMEQRERTRTLDAFRSGQLKVLVATDVAARGLDVPDVGRVIHFDVPDNDEVYTHRSGRTGRAGRKGTSHVLVPPSRQRLVAEMARRARVELGWQPVPGPEQVLEAEAERLEARVLEGPAPDDVRLQKLALQLLAHAHDPADLVTRLLALADQSSPCRPRRVTSIEPRTGHAPGRRASGAPITFRVGWGGRHGADPRRLLALVCRRGKVKSSDIGAIYVGPTSSTVEVSAQAAEQFAIAVRAPDARDGHIRISPLLRPPPPGAGEPLPRPMRGDAPARPHQGKHPFGRHTTAPRWASPR